MTIEEMRTIDAVKTWKELEEARARIAHLEAVLRRIANQDYRGNRSTESQIAAEALNP
jgi:Xaa-Pro aminopeptidase